MFGWASRAERKQGEGHWTIEVVRDVIFDQWVTGLPNFQDLHVNPGESCNPVCCTCLVQLLIVCVWCTPRSQI